MFILNRGFNFLPRTLPPILIYPCVTNPNTQRALHSITGESACEAGESFALGSVLKIESHIYDTKMSQIVAEIIAEFMIVDQWIAHHEYIDWNPGFEGSRHNEFVISGLEAMCSAFDKLTALPDAEIHWSSFVFAKNEVDRSRFVSNVLEQSNCGICAGYKTDIEEHTAKFAQKLLSMPLHCAQEYSNSLRVVETANIRF